MIQKVKMSKNLPDWSKFYYIVVDKAALGVSNTGALLIFAPNYNGLTGFLS